MKSVAFFRDILYDAKFNAQPARIRLNGIELKPTAFPIYEKLYAYENLLDESIRTRFEQQLSGGDLRVALVIFSTGADAALAEERLKSHAYVVEKAVQSIRD